MVQLRSRLSYELIIPFLILAVDLNCRQLKALLLKCRTYFSLLNFTSVMGFRTERFVRLAQSFVRN